MKRIFRQIHLWLSIPFGLLITIVCFSGAMLVFEPEVTGLLRNEQRHDTEKIEQASPAVEKAKKRANRMPFFRTMFRLHRWLLDDKPSDGGVFWGKQIVGITTLMFVLILISGIIVWWPRTRKALTNSLKLTCRKGGARLCYGLHVAGGVYVSVFLLIMALTGLTWSFPWYRAAFCELFGIETFRGSWVYAVHVGNWGGLPTRILAFLAALIGATLPLTGYYLWFRRLSRRKGNKEVVKL